MARSYKRKPYIYLIGVSNSTVRKIRALANRSYRHQVNRGEYDELPVPNQFYRRASDLAFGYDLIRVRYPKDMKSFRKWGMFLIFKIIQNVQYGESDRIQTVRLENNALENIETVILNLKNKISRYVVLEDYKLVDVEVAGPKSAQYLRTSVKKTTLNEISSLKSY